MEKRRFSRSPRCFVWCSGAVLLLVAGAALGCSDGESAKGGGGGEAGSTSDGSATSGSPTSTSTSTTAGTGSGGAGPSAPVAIEGLAVMLIRNRQIGRALSITYSLRNV